MKKRYVIVLVLLLCLAAFAGFRHWQHSFTTEKWVENPAERTMIVDDLLEDYLQIGMTQEEVETLLGVDDNDEGLFVQMDRLVYWMGPERGFFSIDSEWLLVDFQNGLVTGYDIVTD